MVTEEDAQMAEVMREAFIEEGNLRQSRVRYSVIPRHAQEPNGGGCPLLFADQTNLPMKINCGLVQRWVLLLKDFLLQFNFSF
jgi:hypothetical protein